MRKWPIGALNLTDPLGHGKIAYIDLDRVIAAEAPFRGFAIQHGCNTRVKKFLVYLSGREEPLCFCFDEATQEADKEFDQFLKAWEGSP